jgi:predicted nucleic acid-binding protein
MSIIISNASPLISLCSINRIQILKSLWKGIIIPKAVYREVVEEGAGKTGADIISMACKDWIKVVIVQNTQEVEALKAVLDDGEAEVIALGQELNAKLLILDNREPRLFASAANLPIIGTLGVIKLAWRKGLIEDPAAELKKLRSEGFWIDDKLIGKVEKEVNDEKKVPGK